MQFEFIKNRKYFYIWTACLCLSGLVLPLAKGLNWGLDFVGGTEFLLRFEKPVHDDQIRTTLESPDFKMLKGLVVQRVVETLGTSESGGGTTFIVRTTVQPDEIRGVDDRIVRILSEKVAKCKRLSTNSIGPVIGKSLVKNTMKAIFFSGIVILGYMWFRFEFRPGVAATVGLVHDMAAVMTVLTLTRYEVDITIVAAILTVLGYSMNDSIVILDRARENLRLKRRMPYDELINLSINQCLARTIYTTSTTGMTLFALLLLGPMVLRGFSLVMLVGVISGCLSTVAITCPMVVDWHLLVDKPRPKAEPEPAKG